MKELKEINVDWNRREEQIRRVVEGMAFSGLQAGRMARFAWELLEAREMDRARQIAEEAFAQATSPEAINEGMLDEAENAFFALCDVYEELGLQDEKMGAQETWQVSFFSEPPIRLATRGNAALKSGRM
jgi:hypothetical protein